jgi:hypothetical protein
MCAFPGHCTINFLGLAANSPVLASDSNRVAALVVSFGHVTLVKISSEVVYIYSDPSPS